MIALDVLKAGVLLLLAALLQVSVASWLEVGDGHPEVVLVLVVALALRRGPFVGACAGFAAGLVLDVASLETLGLSSLLLTLAGYFSGRFGQVATRASAQPMLLAVALATVGVALGSLVLHFMLGSTIGSSRFLVGVLLPTLALNLLIAKPVYALCRRLWGAPAKGRREVTALG